MQMGVGGGSRVSCHLQQLLMGAQGVTDAEGRAEVAETVICYQSDTGPTQA
jgi:hypothetical protein